MNDIDPFEMFGGGWQEPRPFAPDMEPPILHRVEVLRRLIGKGYAIEYTTQHGFLCYDLHVGVKCWMWDDEQKIAHTASGVIGWREVQGGGA